MKIGPLKKVTKETMRDINGLVKQLRRKGDVMSGSPKDLRDIVASKNAVLIVAQDGTRVAGMGTLYIQQKIGKRTAHIEDVVVDEAYRGQGLGKKIVQALIAAAKARRVGTIHLTSRPEREAANALYQKLGFTLKKTNPYTLYL